jgi:hypothetical protein
MRTGFVLVALLVALAACNNTASIKSTDIVEKIPWTVPEMARYTVFNDDEEIGTAEISIQADGDTFVITQHFDFPDEELINEASVVVGADDLQPVSTTFRIEGPDGVRECDATYESGKVLVHNVGEDGEREDTVDVPIVAYDSWSDLYVWRTVDFSQNYEVEYADILSCVVAKPQRLASKLEVVGGEEIEVPAGTYDTWHLKIDSGDDQDAWFSTDDLHTLVKYDNGELVFELTASDVSSVTY